MSVPADPPPPYDDALSVPQVHSADISLSGHSEDALSQTSASFSVPPPPPSVPPRPAAGVPVQIPSISDPIRPLPTVTAQFGKPLLRDENLLVYPKGWIRCERCGNTGFKASDPERPCKRCWRKYGRTYKGVLKQAFESNEQAPSILQDVVLQAPIRRTSYIPAHPTPVPADWGTARPMYPQQPAYAQLTPQGNVQNYSQYPTNVAARPPARPEVFPEDAHQSVPPTYHLASTTANEKPLSDQQYPNARPPVQPQAPHPPQPMYAYPPRPPAIGPSADWYGYRPPPGAISVRPGDPRIGGVLCPACYGTGDDTGFMSFLFESECPQCGGAGRINIPLTY